jgi:hypothetical protein
MGNYHDTVSPKAVTYFNGDGGKTDRDWQSNEKETAKNRSKKDRRGKEKDDEDYDDRNVVKLEENLGGNEDEGKTEELSQALHREVKMKRMLVGYLIVILGMFVLLIVLGGSMGTCSSKLAECRNNNTSFSKESRP